MHSFPRWSFWPRSLFLFKIKSNQNSAHLFKFKTFFIPQRSIIKVVSFEVTFKQMFLVGNHFFPCQLLGNLLKPNINRINKNSNSNSNYSFGGFGGLLLGIFDTRFQILNLIQIDSDNLFILLFQKSNKSTSSGKILF